jgi:hypothetical protein
MRSFIALFSALMIATSSQAEGLETRNTLNGLTPLEMVDSCAGLSVALISSSKSQGTKVKNQVERFASLSRTSVRLNAGDSDDIHKSTVTTQKSVNTAARKHLDRITKNDPLVAIDTRACAALSRALIDNPALLDPPA